MYKEKELLKSLSISYKKYIEYGSRSTEKLKPIHKYIADTLIKIWGNSFQVHYMGKVNKEMKVSGKYYNKDIDITITKDGKPVICVGIKYIISNYKQNSNNYFENMMGETANIQANNNLPYFQLIFLPQKIPYLKKSTKEITKIEEINKKDLQKYINLVYDNPQTHKPYAIGILLIDINKNTHKIKATNLNDIFEKDFISLFQKKLSIKNLFDEIKNFKTYLLINN